MATSASRRQLLAAGGLAALAAGLPAGCQRSDDEPGELTIISGPDQSRGGQRQALLDTWSQEHPDYRATILEVGGVADAHRSEMVARAQSGRPGVDIYNLDVTWVAEFAEAGYIRPLDAAQLDQDAFLDQPLATCRYDGELWALPFNTDAGLLYLRTDLIPDSEQAPRRLHWRRPGETAPATVDTIDYWIGEAFDAADGSAPLAGGYAGQFASYEGLTVNALETVWALGEGTFDVGDWREPAIDVRQLDEPLRWLAGALSAHPQLVLAEATEYDEADTIEAFRTGKVVFMRNWPVAYRTLQAVVTEEPSDAPTFDVRTLPGPSVLGGQNLAIARDTPRPRAAQRLIEYLTDQQRQRILLRDGGLLATRADVYREEDIEEYPAMQLLRDAIAQARPRPNTPYYARFSEVFRDGVRHSMNDSGRLPENFAERLAEGLRGIRR